MRIKLLVTSISATATVTLAVQAASSAEIDFDSRISGDTLSTLSTLSFPSFTDKEKAQLEKAISKELNVKELKAIADAAYDAEFYCKSLKYYRKAYYAIKFINYQDRDRVDELSLDSFKDLPMRLAENEIEMGNYNIATDLLEKFRGDTADAIKAQNLLAEVCLDNGRFEGAEQHVEEATRLANEAKLTDSALLKTRLLKAKLQVCRNNARDAPRMFSDLATSAAQLGKPGTRLQVEAIIEHANLLRTRYRFSEAENQLRSALKLAEDNFGASSLEAANCLVNLGAVVQETDATTAKEMLLRAAWIQSEHLGTSAHPALAKTFLVLSENDTLTGYESETMCKNAQASVTGILADDSPLFASIFRQLRRVYMKNTKLLPALKASDREIEISDRIYGTKSLQYAQALMGRSAVLMWSELFKYGPTKLKSVAVTPSSEITESFNLAEQAAKLVGEKEGYDSLNYVACLDNLGGLQKCCGKDAESVATLVKALDLCEKASDQNGKATMQNHLKTRLIQACAALKNYGLAEKHLFVPEFTTLRSSGLVSKNFMTIAREVDVIRDGLEEATIKPDEPRAIEPIPIAIKIGMVLPSETTGMLEVMNMIETHYKSGSTNTRLASLKYDLLARERQCGPESPQLQYPILQLAKFFQAQKEYSASKIYFDRAEKIVVEGLGDDHPELLDILPDYIQLLVEMGDSEGAKKKQARCDSISKKYNNLNPKAQIPPIPLGHSILPVDTSGKKR